MEMKKLLFRKEMKLVTLLLTSLLIASASAAVYFSLSMKATVTTTAASPIQFVAGNDSGSSAANAIISGDGTWARLAGLTAYPNVTLTYEQAVNVSNTDSSAHNIRLSHVSISPASGWDVANFTSITFKITNVAGTELASFAYTVSGSGESSTWSTPSPMEYQSLPATTKWSIKVVIVTKPGASEGVAVNIDMLLDVQQ
jgi:hypothetical protein